jgi:hypothetical protein
VSGPVPPPTQPGGAFAELAEELEALFGRGVHRALGGRAFNDLALRVFAFQFGANPVYRAFCERRRATPDSVTWWEDIPAVPATAFKYVDLLCGSPGAVDATYVTSGTTSGEELRGRHHVPRVALYRAAALPNLRAHLVPEDRPLAVLSLIPSPTEAPHSSLSAMMGFVADAWGDPVRWLGDADRGADLEAFRGAVAEARDAGRPALVAGTAFAFVHLLDAMARTGGTLAFPDGSRIMETGGFKGRARAVERDELYGALESRLGIPRGHIVNEYGMTELLSQLYEPVLSEDAGAAGRHVAPPWLKVRALDPGTLAPLPAGEVGLLAFFDLANAGSVCHVLTQDMGTVSVDGVRLQGRAQGAEPRGCSLAVEDLLAAGVGRT